jgi:hypothetical protein
MTYQVKKRFQNLPFKRILQRYGEEPPAPAFPNSFEREMEALERRHFAQAMCDQHHFLVSRPP